MKFFSDCSGECCLCGVGQGCLAGHGDDDFYPATKEQIIERLDKGQFPSYRQMMIDHLKRAFDYDYHGYIDTDNCVNIDPKEEMNKRFGNPFYHSHTLNQQFGEAITNFIDGLRQNDGLCCHDKSKEDETMNKKELENEIMKTQNQLKALQTALCKLEETEKEVPEELIFEYEDEYCYVDETGNICWTSYTNLAPTDTDRVHNHRAFLNERLAEIFADKTQFIADMLHFKYLYDKDYEPNWDSEYEQKFCVYYNTTTEKFVWTCHRSISYAECVYFSSEEVVKKCVNWLNKKHN